MRWCRAGAVIGAVALLASCASGTGEPDWDLPLTWDQNGVSVTLDEGGRASVRGVEHQTSGCAEGAAQPQLISGAGEWRWNGLGRMIVEVDDVELAVYAPSYRGGLDWTRLLIDPCGTNYEGEPPIELFLDGPFAAVGA